MRVAVVTKHFPNARQPWGGHSTYQTLRVLAQQCDLQVFYPQVVYPALLNRRRNLQAPPDPAWNPVGVAATYVPVPMLPVLSRPWNSRLILEHLLPWVRAFRPDVVLSYFLYPDGHAAVRMGATLGVPVVVTAVGSDINRIPNAWVRHLTSQTLRRADFVSTVSHDLCSKARTLGASPQRSRAKLNGCDTSIFYPRDQAKARTELGIDAAGKAIVYVGRLDVRKGLLELVEAVARLVPHTPDLRCYLVGDGPARAPLQECIARHGLESSVLLAPACPTGKVAIWMSAADIVTLPSYAEGCPNVVIEALAAGRPVVATNVGGIPELVDSSCGRLVQPQDAAALAGALQQALEASWHPEEIASRRGRSWQDVARELHEILTSVVSHHPGRSTAK